jgi:dienelactone hydrolase
MSYRATPSCGGPQQPRLRPSVPSLGLWTALVLGLGLASAGPCAQPASVAAAARQRALLDELLRILPKSEPWEQWLKTSGELPPDFEALPSVPFLPDPLRRADGSLATREQWPQQRADLLNLFQRYVLGTAPPSPGNVRATDVRTRQELGSTVQHVTLRFGPNYQAQLHLELIIPPGPGPFPVFLTPEPHRSWALVAVSRGYLGCVYAAGEGRDDTTGWKGLWPDRDWSALLRRAWAASRCVDYLVGLPMVDKTHIGLAGHGRNGRAVLVAAALDSRISAVIASSSGTGGACSWRLCSEAYFGQGIEVITRTLPDEFHPRLRFFAGREAKLPVDQPSLIACLAPRPCLISSALNDPAESIWAIEHTYYSARRAYELLGVTGQLYLRYRPGGHETRPEDIESYVDWLDTVFGRAPYVFPDCILFPTYPLWQELSNERIDPGSFPPNTLRDLLRAPDGNPIVSADQWENKKPDIRRRVAWCLGEAPPFAEAGPGQDAATAPHLARLLGREPVPAGLGKRSLSFGNHLPGDLYFPMNADRTGARLPVVIWLHPIAPAWGYVPAHCRGDPPHLALARLGCAVFAFDQIGHGARIDEVRNFYHRYPHWSLLGKMVEDTLAAVEAVGRVDFVDPRRIWLVGYGLGGMVALHAAALDPRVAGVVSVAGFHPLRTDTLDRGTGGVARWSGWLPLQPRLGAFVREERRIPYDYHELLGLIAPRPALIFTPRIGPAPTLADVRASVAEAAKVFELLWAKANLQFYELDDYDRLSPETMQMVCERLKAAAGLP